MLLTDGRRVGGATPPRCNDADLRRHAPVGEAQCRQMAALIRGRISAANAAVKRHPLATAITVTATKAAVADLMVQLLVERREKLDVRRTGLFGCFGGLYQGFFQYG